MWKLFKRKSNDLEIEYEILKKSAEIRINDFLFEHGKSMIANCIAKSEIYTIYKNKNEKDDLYYLLNVRPNPNQTATEFWLNVINKYFSYKGEVLIVNVGGNLYVADDYIKSNDVLNGKTFSNVTIKIDDDYLKLYKTFSSSENMLIKRIDNKIDKYLENINDKIADLMIASMSGYKKKSPKFSIRVPNGLVLKTKEGNIVTSNDYAKEISNKLDDSSISTLVLPSGLEFEEIKNTCNVSTEEIKSIYNQAANNVAMALNIPINAFLGSITEKSDAIDELITFAVSIVVEQINDSFNYCLMEKESFLNGSKIFFNLSKCKHRDILSNANSIDKLVADGFSHNEILDLFDLPEIDEDWANEHNITKNYAAVDSSKGGEE